MTAKRNRILQYNSIGKAWFDISNNSHTITVKGEAKNNKWLTILRAVHWAKCYLKSKRFSSTNVISLITVC